ncbi:hypothetical protein CHN45_18795 [Vibrio cholerae]|nr:hypothetical protein CHN45_18795 [Vibrio cholerae]
MILNRQAFFDLSFLFFFTVLLLSSVTNGFISNYNVILNFIFCILLLACVKYSYNQILYMSMLFFSLVLVFFLTFRIDYHFAVFLVYFLLMMTFCKLIVSRSTIGYSRFKVYNLGFVAYLILTFSLSFKTSSYSEEGRFLGLLNSTNVSSFVVGLMIIYILEFYTLQLKHYLFKVFIASVVVFYFYTVFQTRTFLIIYVYIFYKLLGARKISMYLVPFIFSMIFLFLIKPLPVENISRFYIDGSISTRISLTTHIVSLSLSDGTYFLIPNGGGATYLKITELLGYKYPLHNDILMYLYDYGVIFVLISCLFAVSVYKGVGLSFMTLSIMLFVFTSNFHNILISVYSIVPMVFIFEIMKWKSKNQGERMS